jgi:lactoylglutathione lyase
MTPRILLALGGALASVAQPALVVAQVPPATAPLTPVARPAAALPGVGIRSRDLDRSIRFYSDIFGMKVGQRLPHGTLTEVILTFGGEATDATIILMKDSAPGKSPPIAMGGVFIKMVITVQDMDALVARLKKAGLPAGEPHGTMGCKILFVTDPDGFRDEVIQLPATAPKG